MISNRGIIKCILINQQRRLFDTHFLVTHDPFISNSDIKAERAENISHQSP